MEFHEVIEVILPSSWSATFLDRQTKRLLHGSPGPHDAPKNDNAWRNEDPREDNHGNGQKPKLMLAPPGFDELLPKIPRQPACN